MTRVVTTRAELRNARRSMSGRVGVVMTMGALHDGHAELVRHAAKAAQEIIVTIFVNPLQFGDATDLDRYPRQLAADIALCEELDVDVVFAPAVDEMYADGTPCVSVAAGRLAERFEGSDRPGHFDGVVTVVSKLLHLTAPDVAVFGQKDAQQLAIIKAMVRDLDFDVEIVAVPTVRESDGVALSSRNQRLSAGERRIARAIPRALAAGLSQAPSGAAAVVAAARSVIDETDGIDAAYVSVIDDETWLDAGDSTVRARLLIAALVGGVRLIDNHGLLLGLPMDTRRVAAA